MRVMRLFTSAWNEEEAVTLNLFQGPFRNLRRRSKMMLKKVQHDDALVLKGPTR
jgi:hypothetical protein